MKRRVFLTAISALLPAAAGVLGFRPAPARDDAEKGPSLACDCPRCDPANGPTWTVHSFYEAMPDGSIKLVAVKKVPRV